MPEIQKRPLPLPTRIGGSRITTERVSGPPSKTYPVLRDLFEDAERGLHEIIVEFDTERGRRRGKLRSLAGASTVWIVPPLESRGADKLPLDPGEWSFGSQPHQLHFKDIIAFRVLEVRGELPALRGSEPVTP